MRTKSMKQPKLTRVLLATSLTLAFASSLVALPARAELVSEEVEADAIQPEQSSLEDEVVIVKKKKPAPVAQRRVVVREETLPMETTSAIEPTAVAMPVAAPVQAQASAQATATATASAPAPRATVGSTLDQGISNKMDDVRNQFENALLKTLDRIKITVDDGASASATATATATATAAPAAPAAPVTTTIVNDSLINASAAPANYMSVESAPAIDEESNSSVAEADDEEEPSTLARFRIAPVGGISNIGSDYYDIKSRYTLGVNLEMDVTDNFSAYVGYTYSQYDIGLGMGGLGGLYGNPYAYGNNLQFGSYNQLQYNQNLFEVGGKFYLFPRESAFRLYVGAGLGLNKGYVNYRSRGFGGYNPYFNLNDYELTSYLGILSTGAEFRVARNVSIGADFKYATVLSSSENDRLRNYGFYGAYGGDWQNVTSEQYQAGSSIAREGFYSILGTVKVGF